MFSNAMVFSNRGSEVNLKLPQMEPVKMPLVFINKPA